MTEQYGEYEQVNGAVANRLRDESSQMREALIEIASGVVPRHVDSPSDDGTPPRFGTGNTCTNRNQ